MGGLRDAVPADDRGGDARAHVECTRPGSGQRSACRAGAALLVAGGAAAWMFLPVGEPPVTLAVAAPAALHAASAAVPALVAMPAIQAHVAAVPLAVPAAVSESAPAPASAPEPAAATVPAPTPRPRRVAKAADAAQAQARTDASVASPREQCRSHVLLAWYRCVKRACQASPALEGAHECQRVRQIEADNARQRTQSQ